MSEVKKIATRESYGNALVELAKEHDDIVVLDADLAEATKTSIFKKAYPERHIDCGIAEANMMGIAAGLSTCGKVPFASTFAMFAAGRAYEQVRNSIGYTHLNVKIGATHAGISVGEDGATHQCNEDIALMRTIPGMTVICPCDDIETKAAVKAAYEMDGPVYLADGINAEVINIHTIKPLDEDIIVESAKKTGKVVTVEEHSVIGGLGSAVCDALSSKLPTKVTKLGVQDVFGHSGPAVELLKEFKLDGEGIYQQVKETLA